MSPTGNCKSNSGEIDVVGLEETPTLSRTHQYRKVMKPLLERKRRARINSYLDELKDLMVTALQAEGESITKLEKADVLELTLKHLQKLKRQQMLKTNPAIDMDRYRAGYTACASEIGRVMSSVPGVNINFGTQLMSHLGERVSSLKPSNMTSINQQNLTSRLRLSSPSYSNQQNSSCIASTVNIPELSIPKEPNVIYHSATFSPLSDRGYNSGRETSPSPSSKALSPTPISPIHPAPHVQPKVESVWRPF